MYLCSMLPFSESDWIPRDYNGYIIISKPYYYWVDEFIPNGNNGSLDPTRHDEMWFVFLFDRRPGTFWGNFGGHFLGRVGVSWNRFNQQKFNQPENRNQKESSKTTHKSSWCLFSSTTIIARWMTIKSSVALFVQAFRKPQQVFLVAILLMEEILHHLGCIKPSK